MSKLADNLRALKIHNNHGLLTVFGDERDVWIDYVPPEVRQVRAARSMVHSVHHRTDPNGHYSDYGAKSFSGNRAASMPCAIAWATEAYGITEWAPSPFGGKIPARVLAKAKAAVKS
jgi:hypothetical protein